MKMTVLMLVQRPRPSLNPVWPQAKWCKPADFSKSIPDPLKTSDTLSDVTSMRPNVLRLF